MQKYRCTRKTIKNHNGIVGHENYNGTMDDWQQPKIQPHIETTQH